MSNPMDWLRNQSGRLSRVVGSSDTTVVQVPTGNRNEAIAALRLEIARLQHELIELSQTPEESVTADVRARNEKSTAATERSLLDAQRKLATFQARV